MSHTQPESFTGAQYQPSLSSSSSRADVHSHNVVQLHYQSHQMHSSSYHNSTPAIDHTHWLDRTVHREIRRCSAATRACTCKNYPMSAKPSQLGRYEPPSQVPHLIPSVIIATTHQQLSSQHRPCLHSSSALTARLHVWLVQLSLVILCSQLRVDKERRLATAAQQTFQTTSDKTRTLRFQPESNH